MGSGMERESQSPLSHPFEIQVQGHEPREEWQRGPAPGQTGSHRTGPQSSSPCLAPSHPCPPPSGPGLWESDSRPPVDRPEPCTTESHSRASAGLGLFTTRTASTSERVLQRWRCCSMASSWAQASGWGPVESAADDNPHLSTRPLCLQGLRRSTRPHGNSGRAVHTM